MDFRRHDFTGIEDVSPISSECAWCSGNYEDVNLLLRRWVGASTSDSREVGRVYCIANVELLTYHQQCQLMEDLRILMVEFYVYICV